VSKECKTMNIEDFMFREIGKFTNLLIFVDGIGLKCELYVKENGMEIKGALSFVKKWSGLFNFLNELTSVSNVIDLSEKFKLLNMYMSLYEEKFISLLNSNDLVTVKIEDITFEVIFKNLSKSYYKFIDRDEFRKRFLEPIANKLLRGN